MAVVYRAVLRESAAGFEKHLALKRMLKELSEDPEFITRFTDEARIVSTLNHENIAQVFDFGQVDGEYFLAMELIDGVDLGTLLRACAHRGQKVPVPVAVQIAASVARGLGAAHARMDAHGRNAPVVHRDVSPQNVLVSRTGSVKIVDFGIAQAADKAIRTRPGILMGKFRYMAPEQTAGDNVDVRADIFATGAVLFELLTTRPLFQGDSPAGLLRSVVSQPIEAVSAQNPDVPAELDRIAARCLARPRDERYPDGSALARDLEALLHRMAPDHSCDDLAAFIEALVPRPKPAPRAALAPANDPDGLDDTLLADPRAGSEPRAAAQDSPDDTEGAPPPDPPTEPTPRPDDTEGAPPPDPSPWPASLSAASAIWPDGRDPDPSPDSDLGRSGTDRVPPGNRGRPPRLLWLGAGILALLAGGTCRVIRGDRPATPVLATDNVIRHDGLTMRVGRVQRTGRQTRVDLVVRPGSGAARLEALRFTLGGRAPHCWSPDPAGRHVTLIFRPPPGEHPVLVHTPPGGAPTAVRLRSAAP